MPFDFRKVGLPARPENVPESVVTQLLQKIDQVRPEYIKCGNAILPDAGHYLSKYSLRALVREELSYEAARIEIKENKKLFQRIANLLPTICDLFEPPDPENVAGFTSSISDCCHDYAASLKSKRKDRKEREALNAINDASKKLRMAIDAVRSAERFASLCYDLHQEIFFDPEAIFLPRAERQKRKMKQHHTPSIDSLLLEMELCRSAFEIAKASAQLDRNTLYLSGNDGKTSVVHYAHDMSLSWNGPKISTSPGSNFSILCSLLFECATGLADESLAGAINRYARSQERTKKEREEREYREEIATSDNFDEQRNLINRSRETITECELILKSSELD
jgi:hypothetical protein